MEVISGYQFVTEASLEESKNITNNGGKGMRTNLLSIAFEVIHSWRESIPAILRSIYRPEKGSYEAERILKVGSSRIVTRVRYILHG